MQAGDHYSPIYGRITSRWRKAEKVDCKLISFTCQVTSECSSQLATSSRAQNVLECDGEAWFDFIPSCILMSAALQLDLLQGQGVKMNVREICQDDPLLWHHPMLSDKSSSSWEWFMKGRLTPGMFHFLNLAYIIYMSIIRYSTWCSQSRCLIGLNVQSGCHWRLHWPSIKAWALGSHTLAWHHAHFNSGLIVHHDATPHDIKIPGWEDSSQAT